MPIKLLLLAAIIVIGVLAMRGSASAGRRAFWRLSALGVLALGAASVVFPNALTGIAQSLGVHRGADLLLYVLAITFMVVVTFLFRRIGELEDRYTEIVRQFAISEAERVEAGRGAHRAASTPAPRSGA